MYSVHWFTRLIVKQRTHYMDCRVKKWSNVLSAWVAPVKSGAIYSLINLCLTTSFLSNIYLTGNFTLAVDNNYQSNCITGNHVTVCHR